MEPNPLPPALYMTGLASQYPPYLLGTEELEKHAARFHDVNNPGIQKLLHINRSTGIHTRSAIQPLEIGFATKQDAPSTNEIDRFFRKAGVDLTVQACKKALAEACVVPEQVTHTVGVTCTNQGNPGYDLLVASNLKLPLHVDRTLLHGVGCAGGLSILRVAAQIASGASLRQKPARILAFACELCTPHVRHYLSLAAKCTELDEVNIAAALFSDGAAAFVLCNEYAIAQDKEIIPLFEVLEWGHDLIPDTTEDMSFYADKDGYRATLSRNIAKYTTLAIGPLFERLLPLYERRVHADLDLEEEYLRPLGVADFDWALHPGGKTIIDGAEHVLQLSKAQLQATRDIYRTRGNSSSASVLIVLDRLRSLGKRRHVVATSFGPGLTIEMVMLKRC